jgi:hypothetical protein
MQNALIKTTTQSLQKLSRALAITEKILTNALIEDVFYVKLIEVQRISLAIDLALNARLELDWYYDLFDLDVLKIFESDESKSEWKIKLIKKILERLKNKDLSFKPNMGYQFPKNKEENRDNVYTVFEDYVMRYLLGTIILDYQDVLLSEKSINYNEEIFSTEKILDNDRAPARFVQWQEDNFVNGNYRFLAHFDIKKFFLSVEHEKLLEIISNTLKLNETSFFYQLLKSALIIRDISNDEILEKRKGLVIQAVDRFFSDIFLKSIDDEFSGSKILYQRKMDDIIVLFNDLYEYEIINAKIQNSLHKIGLELNNQKTKLIDKESCNFKEAYYDQVYNRHSDDSYVPLYFDKNLAVLYFDINSEQKRYSFWGLSTFRHKIDNNGFNIQNYEEDVFVKDMSCIQNLSEDIIGLQSLPESDWYFKAILKEILLSRISVEMKMKMIKQHNYDVCFLGFYAPNSNDYSALGHDQLLYLNYFILKNSIQRYSLNSALNINILREYIVRNFENVDCNLDYNLNKSIIQYFST